MPRFMRYHPPFMLWNPLPATRASIGALLLLLGLRSVPASAGGLTSPEAGARLAPGSLGTAAWSADSVIAAAPETELVLSLDGGVSFPIRLTRDLDPAIGSVQFRVPRLETRHARLAMRIGSNDAERGEIIAIIGSEFVIEPDPETTLEPLVSLRGEWRTREALDESASAFPAEPSLAGDSTRFSALALPVDLDGPPPALLVTRALPAAPERIGAIAEVLPPPAPLCRAPISRPKRE